MKLKTQIKAGLGGGWMSNNHNQPTALRLKTNVKAGLRGDGWTNTNHNQTNPHPTGI